MRPQGIGGDIPYPIASKFSGEVSLVFTCVGRVVWGQMVKPVTYKMR